MLEIPSPRARKRQQRGHSSADINGMMLPFVTSSTLLSCLPTSAASPYPEQLQLVHGHDGVICWHSISTGMIDAEMSQGWRRGHEICWRRHPHLLRRGARFLKRTNSLVRNLRACQDTGPPQHAGAEAVQCPSTFRQMTKAQPRRGWNSPSVRHWCWPCGGRSRGQSGRQVEYVAAGQPLLQAFSCRRGFGAGPGGEQAIGKVVISPERLAKSPTM